MVRSVFSKLKDIRIGCTFGHLDSTHTARRALANLVASAADLEILQLNLTDYPFQPPEDNGPETSCCVSLSAFQTTVCATTQRFLPLSIWSWGAWPVRQSNSLL